MMRRVWLALAVMAVIAGRVPAGPVTISEVLYDATGPDNGKTFVELCGPDDTSLDGYVLNAVNGSGGGITHSIALDGLEIPISGFLLLADLDSSGNSAFPFADAFFTDLDYQNGPDSVVLMSEGSIVDALGYGSFSASMVFAGEGAPAADAGPGFSVSRWFAAVDTDSNAADFHVTSPTPGFGLRIPVSVPTPEASSLVLMLSGLAVLRRRIRRRYS
jgi:hypothetical protein